MKCGFKPKKKIFRETLTAMLMLFLITGVTLSLLEKSIYFVSKAESNNTEWNATIFVSEPYGTGNTVVLGEASDASDGQDDYDRPSPPPSPQLPFLGAWFNTNLDRPYESLLVEYKKYPSEHQIWNLTILWESGSTNDLSTYIDIKWDSSEFTGSLYDSILLYNDDNTVVSDMTKDNVYTFNTDNNTVFQFQIICQSETSTENNETPNLTLILTIIIIIIFASIIVAVIYRKRK